jgi:hypothetical protein
MAAVPRTENDRVPVATTFVVVAIVAALVALSIIR